MGGLRSVILNHPKRLILPLELTLYEVRPCYSTAGIRQHHIWTTTNRKTPLRTECPLPQPPCDSPGGQENEGGTEIAPIGGTCLTCGKPTLFSPLSPSWIDARGVMRPTAASLVGWLHRGSMWLHKVHSCGRAYIHEYVHVCKDVHSPSIHQTINQQCRDSLCHPRKWQSGADLMIFLLCSTVLWNSIDERHSRPGVPVAGATKRGGGRQASATPSPMLQNVFTHAGQSTPHCPVGATAWTGNAREEDKIDTVTDKYGVR
ncbi:hypothetical protein CCMA1212_004667 [Trichoderma ghanense]|uniref:Uncharacterized protein n=1 Tax=Trichoderma ghanense TaxID=65468 RepID=A0ABY2H8M4_9HYPO